MKEKYISRIKSGHTNCYFVRVPPFARGKCLGYSRNPVNKSFPKGVGTWKAALEKAIAWRDNYLTEHNAVDMLLKCNRMKRGASKFTGRTKSGVIGVFISTCTKESGTYYYWTAITSVDGVHSNKTFAIGLYGNKAAFKWACMHRFKHMGVLNVTDRSLLPCTPPVSFMNMKTGKLTIKNPFELRTIFPSELNFTQENL